MSFSRSSIARATFFLYTESIVLAMRLSFESYHIFKKEVLHMDDTQGICSWALRSDLERSYHDNEWGKPLHDDKKIFEFLVLETMQAGLSWTLILQRREAMRQAFDHFNIDCIAEYDDKKEGQLLENPSIIRNRLKVSSLRKNALAFKRIQGEFGSFDTYIWGFTKGQSIVGHWQSLDQVPAKTTLSDTISKDMKKRGFTFVGSTIVYSFLQAIGIVNDHLITCPQYKELCDL